MKENDQNLLQLAKVFSGEVREIPFEIRPSVPSLEENGITLSSVCFSGRAWDLSGFVRLTGLVTARLSAPCARCLTTVEEDFSAEIDLPVVKEITDGQEEVLVAEGETVDLDALMQEVILTDLPLRLLCREDCKGLCTKCGKDLNDGPCQCDHKEIDPRLQGLADFFNS